MDRVEVVHENFLARVADGNLPVRRSRVLLDESGLCESALVEIFRSQVLSRQLDRTARALQARGEGFYTIASSGHEGSAAIAEAFRVDDMAFLHYRDAAFQIQRATKLPGQTPAWDMLLGFVASADDPISGGRHKVLGSKSLFIPPQTSTIASHLPKAMGLAYSIDLARRLKRTGTPLADDSVVLCSFGDASANHSTAQGAINAACWSAYQGVPIPLIFICEDNGVGISTRTPENWIEAAFSGRPALEYLSCDGLDVLETYSVAREAESYARRDRRPVFLHMKCVRLYGHAGSDVQTTYLSRGEIEAAEAQDPLLHTARLLIENDVLSNAEILEIYRETGEETERIAEEAVRRPKLETSAEVMASLLPPERDSRPSGRAGLGAVSLPERDAAFSGDRAEMDKPQHMARLLNWTLTDLMLEDGTIVLAGEDIGRKGGVYNVTSRLLATFGRNRVLDTLLDEQSILGLAIGLAHNGFLPIVEIQFLAYLHNAEDQLRGEAATLSFFSKGQFTNPMIIRLPGLAYQKGFGGHFHNDNSLAVVRDIPGVVIACPSNGRDAVLMLRECARVAREQQRVIVFVEPIALYRTRDLHEEDDGLWTSRYPDRGDDQQRALGEIGLYGQGTDLAMISYGNGYRLCRQAERILAVEHGVQSRVVDLRWLAPLDIMGILSAIDPCHHVLIVDECRGTGSQSEAIAALISERADPPHQIARLFAKDSFIALGQAATLTLPSRDSIVEAALDLLSGSRDANQEL
ncbi:MAG: MFS transporter [Deltaproteobacteria bacterium]|nr:MFS transporter [Deltaproteobacteria bacterium]